MTSKCFICETDLLPASSVSLEKKAEKKYAHIEHIIPNAIGGKLKSNKIICAACGESFGKEIDIALVKHCHSFATLLDVNRDRGKNQDVIAKKKDGEEIAISAQLDIKPIIKGKPKVKLKTTGQPETIIARSSQELKMYEGILKKKYLGFKYTIENVKTYENDILRIPHIISSDTYRGVCKIAVEFYLEKGGSKEEIDHLLPYLKNELGNSQQPVHMYYPSGGLNLDNQVYHFIHLKGIKEPKILFAYIKLFGVSGHFIALNWGKYGGEDIEYNYLYDLLEKKEQIPKLITFNYSEANTFLGEVQADLKKGNEYIIRDDMKESFMNRIKQFEAVIKEIRAGIDFKQTKDCGSK